MPEKSRIEVKETVVGSKAMPRDFIDPSPEEQRVVLIDAATLREAERLIESCEHCNPEGVKVPFDAILDRITDSDPRVTDYILEQPGKCPQCFWQMNENTSVDPKWTVDDRHQRR